VHTPSNPEPGVGSNASHVGPLGTNPKKCEPPAAIPLSPTTIETVGAVASLFIVTVFESDPPSLVAEHVISVPAVSVLIVAVSHPVV
jgi:hypothetical protein